MMSQIIIGLTIELKVFMKPTLICKKKITTKYALYLVIYSFGFHLF